MSQPPVIIHYRDDMKSSDRELRLTVRSMAKNLCPHRLIIVGDKPKWASREVEHVPFDHPYRKNKDANIANAIIKGALHLLSGGYKGNVIVAADDCAVLKPVDVQCYSSERFGDFMEKYIERVKQNVWWEYPFRAMIHCLNKGWRTDCCTGHTPTRVSVGSIMTLIDIPFGEKHYSGYTLMSNVEKTFEKLPFVYAKRCHPKTLMDWVKDNDVTEMQSDFCNWCNQSGTVDFFNVLESLFPSKSHYEKGYA